MDQRVVEFIAALRTGGVRISLAESADTFQVIEQIGVMDRESFRIAIRSALIKEQRDISLFEKLFPLFFQADTPPVMENAAKDLSPQEARLLAAALRQFSHDLRQRMEKLLKGEPLSRQEMDQLDRLLNTGQENDLRYQNWLARQMEMALNFREVRRALEELLQLLNQMGMDREQLRQMREALKANQQALQDQLRQHAGQQILQNMIHSKPQPDSAGLAERPFSSFSEEDMQLLRKEVRRLAAALRTRLALRLKRSRTGQIDPKATLRANLKHGSIPIDLRFRNHTLKPKLVVICDISTSMRYCSELMLSLLYAIQDQISKTSAFAFIDHLEYITPDFQRNLPTQAIDQVLQRMPPGHYNTDLGFALSNFQEEYLDAIDHRTTLIIVSDGRNNYNDPHLGVFKALGRRARTTIWLNPEPQPLWGTGDSDMHRYAPLCDRTFQVGNLGQLAAAIDQLLLH